MKTLICLATLILLAITPIFSAPPSHPDKLHYPPLERKIPSGIAYRSLIGDSIPAYIVADRSLPIVTVTLYFRAGTLLDPRGFEGLGALAATCLRTGGAGTIHTDSLDAILDKYAILISSSIDETKLAVKLTCLSQYTDTAFSLLSKILFSPAFDKKVVERERAIAIQAAAHRFDNPEPILAAAWRAALYPQWPNNRLSSEKSLSSITIANLKTFAETYITHGHVSCAASGDFNTDSMTHRITALLAPVKRGPAPVFPTITADTTPQCLIVHKQTTQAYLRMGCPLFTRPHLDYYPLLLENQILGDGGFSSRLIQSVRSDAGLTYSIYSMTESNYSYPGTFFINYFTKSETVNAAAALSLVETRAIRDSNITPAELDRTKQILVDELLSSFRTKQDIVETYLWNEYTGRPADIFQRYAAELSTIAPDSARAVFARRVDPSKFIVVAVGDTTALFSAPPATGFELKTLKNRTVITPSELEKR